MENKQIDILDVLLILAKHKKFIFFTTLIASVAAVIFSLITPEYWVSTATILPAQDQKNQLSLSSSSLVGLGSSLLGESLQVNGLDLLIIMNSRTFSEDVIEKFNLVEYMEIEHEDSLVVKEKALKGFTENIRDIGINEENGLINISIETKDKYLSTDIANYYWQKLEEYNLNSRMSKGKQKRIFLEGRVKEVESIIDSLSITLLHFQKENNIIVLEKQTSEIVELYANLFAQKTTKEIELEYYQQITESNSPILDKLILENDILASKISELEINSSDGKKYILSIDNIPKIALEYARITIDLKIQKQVYSFIYPQYEQAKIEEIKDLPTIEIIDKATSAGLRSKPHRAKFCIMAFILSLILSSFLVYSVDVFQNSNNNIKLRELKTLLFRKPQDR
ncbi:MAG: hypothetical protein J7K29_01735 [Candidatus Cloacimonetes bacterium]|nr:hypothetical protein [Candidatus Cloacimonadota bacterium]